MSEDILATVITVGIIGAMFAWVPLLKIVCPPCISYLERRRRRMPVAQRTLISTK